MPARFLLDTNILSDLIRNPAGLVAKGIARVGEQTICTSVVVAAELRFGARKSRSKLVTERVGVLLSAIDVLPLEPPMDRTYGELRYELHRLGTPIGPNDLLIASQALALNLILVSANLREFARIDGLQLENWLSE